MISMNNARQATVAGPEVNLPAKAVLDAFSKSGIVHAFLRNRLTPYPNTP
jgi:hypothetical protein